MPSHWRRFYCVVCRAELPRGSREHRKTCSAACRKKLSRLGAVKCDSNDVTDYQVKRDHEAGVTDSDHDPRQKRDNEGMGK